MFMPLAMVENVFAIPMQRNVTHMTPINGCNKCIVDVSRVPYYDFLTIDDAFSTMASGMNVHQPIPKICPKPQIMDHSTALRINHYTGSLEAFGGKRKNYRRGKELGRNYEKWQQKANLATGWREHPSEPPLLEVTHGHVSARANFLETTRYPYS
jgi:hypothetical protein